MKVKCKLGFHKWKNDELSATIYGELKQTTTLSSIRDMIIVYYGKCERCGIEVIFSYYIERDIKFIGFDKSTKEEKWKRYWKIDRSYGNWIECDKLHGDTIEEKKYDMAFRDSQHTRTNYLNKVKDLTKEEFEDIEYYEYSGGCYDM